mmetsp:Transcript_31845/g.79455  ORF Transcript_31845/g.79455 Transcript_31845/m.79455 type:complete len:206 (-) Transcript_31845:438-1055(-)
MPTSGTKLSLRGSGPSCCSRQHGLTHGTRSTRTRNPSPCTSSLTSAALGVTAEPALGSVGNSIGQAATHCAAAPALARYAPADHASVGQVPSPCAAARALVGSAPPHRLPDWRQSLRNFRQPPLDWMVMSCRVAQPGGSAFAKPRAERASSGLDATPPSPSLAAIGKNKRSTSSSNTKYCACLAAKARWCAFRCESEIAMLRRVI